MSSNGSIILPFVGGEGLGITTLSGDVSATGPGPAVATVNSVGGQSAANVASAVAAVNAGDFATKTLSNLASPTAINQNLLFSSDGTFNIGDGTGHSPLNIFATGSGNVNVANITNSVANTAGIFFNTDGVLNTSSDIGQVTSDFEIWSGRPSRTLAGTQVAGNPRRTLFGTFTGTFALTDIGHGYSTIFTRVGSNGNFNAAVQTHLARIHANADGLFDHELYNGMFVPNDSDINLGSYLGSITATDKGFVTIRNNGTKADLLWTSAVHGNIGDSSGHNPANIFVSTGITSSSGLFSGDGFAIYNFGAGGNGFTFGDLTFSTASKSNVFAFNLDPNPGFKSSQLGFSNGNTNDQFYFGYTPSDAGIGLEYFRASDASEHELIRFNSTSATNLDLLWGTSVVGDIGDNSGHAPNNLFINGKAQLGTPTSNTVIHQINGGLNTTTRTITANLTIDTTTTDYIILCNQSSGITITFPAPTNGRILVIKDISGTAQTNNITMAQHSTEKIEGLAVSKLLETSFGSWTFTSDGTDWWMI